MGYCSLYITRVVQRFSVASFTSLCGWFAKHAVLFELCFEFDQWHAKPNPVITKDSHPFCRAWASYVTLSLGLVVVIYFQRLLYFILDAYNRQILDYIISDMTIITA